ncbi:hypothetical protein TWF281_004641 [Arthrobotrys megalospora]
MAQLPLQWKEIEPKTWARGFCSVEKILHFFKHLNPSLTQWTVTSGVVLPENSSYSVEDIKAAWVALRVEHPIIACTITEQKTGIQYRVPNEEELNQWVEETVHIDMSGKTGRELAMSAAAPKSAELFFLPERRELMIHMRHELTDGAGSMILVNNFLKTLRLKSGTGNLELLGEEVARLPPSLFQIVGEEGPLSQDLLEKAQGIGMKYLKNPSIGLKTRSTGTSDAIPSIPSGRVEHEFSEAETASIIEACRAKAITVSTAVVAAEARAVLEHGGETSGNLTTLIPINLRDQLLAPYSTHAGGNLFIASFTVLPISVDDDFVGRAKAARRELTTWQRDISYVAYTKPLMELLEEGITAAMQTGVALPAGFILSSLGVVEKYVTEPIDDYWLNLVVSTASTGGFFIYTAKGRLRFAACYNEAYYDEGEVEKFVGMTVRNLKEGLGLAS